MTPIPQEMLKKVQVDGLYLKTISFLQKLAILSKVIDTILYQDTFLTKNPPNEKKRLATPCFSSCLQFFIL